MVSVGIASTQVKEIATAAVDIVAEKIDNEAWDIQKSIEERSSDDASKVIAEQPFDWLTA